MYKKEHTWLGTRQFGIFISWFIHPGLTISADEAGESLLVHFVACPAKGRLLASGGTLLLFANHQVNFFGLDVLADMPCGQTVFVLFFSASEVGNVRAL